MCNDLAVIHASYPSCRIDRKGKEMKAKEDGGKRREGKRRNEKRRRKKEEEGISRRVDSG